jgi:ComF family protein
LALVTTVLARASRLTADLLFPPRCALCGRGGRFICESCIAALPAAAGARCQRCWVPVRGRGSCRHCLESPPAFASLQSAFVMTAGARALAHQLKYDGMTALAEPMADLIVEALAPFEADVVVPVPLHRGRERRRGYNQAAALAKGIGRRCAVPVGARAVRRVRDTAPLAKAMSRDERRAIVTGAFAAWDAGSVEGRRVLLVDDVATTGATLDACARAALDAGAASVWCVTWARED